MKNFFSDKDRLYKYINITAACAFVLFVFFKVLRDDTTESALISSGMFCALFVFFYGFRFFLLKYLGFRAATIVAGIPLAIIFTMLSRIILYDN